MTDIRFDSDESLDPGDWSEFRALAHRMVDDSLDFLATLSDRAPWEPMPPAVRGALTSEPIPRQPQSAEQAYAEFKTNVLPYANGNRHPRFWGWIQGNGTPLGMMADMLAAGMNAHLAGLDHAPKLVELQVIAWLAELMGFPKDSSGILLSGGTMANILGLAVARHVKSGKDFRETGVSGSNARLIVYGSTETHSWSKKGVALLGMGYASLRLVPVNDDFTMNIGALTKAIADDRAAGHLPICVLGTAGTVNSGAVDDLNAIADICRKDDLWFHVDGAFGALVAFSPTLAPMVAGMERADSLAFDLHKWMYLPYEIACLLVKDGVAHRDTFAITANYLRDEGRGVIAGGLPFADRGPELTRGFKALKVWMSLKAHGVDAIARVIEQNCEQAKEFAARVVKLPNVVLCAPVSMNVACFRVAPPQLTPAQQDELNKELLLQIQETGLAIPSGTLIQGRYVIRVACSNHRSRWSDFELLLDGIATLSTAIQRQRGAVLALAGEDGSNFSPSPE